MNNNDGGIIDVGGASSEIFVFIDKKITYSKSLNIGAVTITDKCGQNKNKALEFSNDANLYRFVHNENDVINVRKYLKSGSPEEILNDSELDLTNLVIRIKNSL